MSYEAQLSHGHRYYNDLIELERTRREAQLEAILKYKAAKVAYDTAQKAEEAYLTVQTAIRTARSGQPKADTQNLNAEAHELKKAARDTAKTWKKAFFETRRRPGAQKRLEVINKAFYAARKQRYNGSPAFWGTKLVTDQAFESARSTTGTFKMPRFRRWSKEGRIAVQIQKGIPVGQLFTGESTAIRLDPIPSDTYTRRRHHRRLASRTNVHIRIGSNGRTPVWATFPVILHRPFPPDAVIKWAWVRRFKKGLHFRYELQLIFEAESFRRALPTREPEKVIAIDVGWRHFSDQRVRVAYWHDNLGDHGEIAVPEKVLRGLEKVDDLKSIRSKAFDAILARFVDWKKTAQLPSWFIEKTQYVHQWKAQRRLQALINTWAEVRFDGDTQMHEAVQAWAKQDRHLHRWEDCQRSRRLGLRREFYRTLAVRWARTYDAIIVERFDLTKFACSPVPEDGLPSDEKKQRFWAKRAAPGELRSFLKEAAEKYEALFEEVAPEYTTLDCHLCGYREKWDAAPRVEHTCTGCKKTWDQDYNAAINLLGRSIKPVTLKVA